MKSKHLLCAVSLSLLLAGALWADDTGSVTGKITLSGKPPAPKVKSADTDPHCKAMHPTGLTIDYYPVDASGGLANVFVYVKEGLAGKKFTPSATPVLLNQQGCMYNPTMVGLQVGQTLVIQNSDDTSHNIHCISQKGQDFNFLQGSKGMKNEKKFDKPEVLVKFRCDVHDWMTAYAGVVDHPFFAVTGADGTFKITGLPPGDYTLAAVHPKAGEQTVKVKVAAGETKADFKPFTVK